VSGASSDGRSRRSRSPKKNMKPFRLPQKHAKEVDDRYRRKNRVVDLAVAAMEAVMRDAVDYIIANIIEGSDHFPQPTLNKMFQVSDTFYRNVITEAYVASHREKPAQNDSPNHKKLAKLPVGIPRTLKDLEKVFRDRRYWPKVMKRSKALTEKLRKAYMGKLRRKFNQVMPKIRAGELTPAEAKKDLMEAWKTSKSRVETIFRTETTTYFTKTQIAFFSGDDEILGFMFDAVKDSSSTDICRTRHGLVYKPGSKLLHENEPPCHYNCRSQFVALANTESNRKLVEDPSRDPENRKVAPLPSGWRK
jgi:SPP1 gp7 family putative phage head morphogenesis protein